jgi:hypothetical protein
MSKSHVVTLRMPDELKRKLEREAKYQGVSINQLTNYLLTIQLTQLESTSILEHRLSKKSKSDLKAKVQKILEKVPDRPVPNWDRIE